MFLKAVKESVATWKKSYVQTPSIDTGPSFTYLRSEFGTCKFILKFHISYELYIGPENIPRLVSGYS